MERVQEAWNVFFFRRTSQEGCQVGGVIRIAFGVLFVADRLLLVRDLDKLLSPSHGVIPLVQQIVSLETWSLLQMDPQNDKLLWGLYWVGLIQGILLVFGILPRLQVLGIYLNLVSFHRHNNLMWDEADVMLRLWYGENVVVAGVRISCNCLTFGFSYPQVFFSSLFATPSLDGLCFRSQSQTKG
jgi:hypothetical protein